ncbi:uncharacterized protein TNCV_3260601 [Trichonephila clavipes]|nr:uncharacterized protein TNCV_3260601 [Trichonephila clavipes]
MSNVGNNRENWRNFEVVRRPSNGRNDYRDNYENSRQVNQWFENRNRFQKDDRRFNDRGYQFRNGSQEDDFSRGDCRNRGSSENFSRGEYLPPLPRWKKHTALWDEEWLCIVEPFALMRACSWKKSSDLECISFQPPFGGRNGCV